MFEIRRRDYFLVVANLFFSLEGGSLFFERNRVEDWDFLLVSTRNFERITRFDITTLVDG